MRPLSPHCEAPVRESEAGAPGRDKPRHEAMPRARSARPSHPGSSPVLPQAAEAPPSGSVVGLQVGLPRALQAWWTPCPLPEALPHAQTQAKPPLVRHGPGSPDQLGKHGSLVFN